MQEYKAKKQAWASWEFTTTKIKLNTFCKDKELFKEINVYISDIAKALVEFSKFLNLNILQKLERVKEIPKMDQLFFCQIFSIMCGKGFLSAWEKCRAMYQAYSSTCTEGLDHFEHSYWVRIVNTAEKDYMAACKNYVVIYINRYIAKGFKHVLDTLLKKFKVSGCNKVCIS